MTQLFYYPEMNEKKPAAPIEARLAYYGNHYYLETPLTLKGRGVTFISRNRPEDLTESGQRKAGWNVYKVTMLAFDKIKQQHDVSCEMLLD